MNTLPVDVKAEDKRLETTASRASEELAKLRWHWTLDESNPGRVSIREYARATGKHLKTISTYANGYAIFTGDGAPPVTLAVAIERAGMGSETAAAAEAVATVRGVGVGRARATRSTEIRRVRDIARQRAEERGTSIEEEAQEVAGWIRKSEEAEVGRRAERKERLGLRFVEMESYLAKVKRELLSALNIAREVPWGDEERELLEDTLGNVRALLNLVDVALVGAADIDWDKELSKITEDVA